MSVVCGGKRVIFSNDCEHDIPPLAKVKPVKRDRGTKLGVSYREALASYKMAIIGVSYPDDKLVVKDVKHIQMAILREIDEGHLNGVKIRDNFVLKVVEAKDFAKPFKVAFMIWDLTTGDPKVFFKCIQLLNQGLCTEHWKVVHRQTDSTRQCLIMMIDQESAAKIKDNGLTAFTGMDRGPFKIIFDPSKKAAEEEEEAAV
ncbi:hypothetical protein ANN_08657 [Periplaneta americana]|uniref:DUF4780 domain-containing protein n=1 Tax=Periplaneta americana TaxID=6978 RepID=A0ABQ8T219_PERAM|nr:hypothetical protein ANN_08657 [Periplaneta americana]